METNRYRIPEKTADYIQIEEQYGAHNYHPLPVVLSKGLGPFGWDVEGKRYYDFLSGYSAVNQDHCQPKIVGALSEHAIQVIFTSRDHPSQYKAYVTATVTTT